jgi:intracellular sulfur oxidation DsrE/DsrF family protein
MMQQYRRWIFGVSGAVAAVFALWAFVPSQKPSALYVPEVSQAYEPQRVVYHVSTRGSWRDRAGEAWRLANVLRNHADALEPFEGDLRVVLQGDGIDILQRAKDKPRLAAAFDALKKRGIRFVICRNSLIAYSVPLEALHGAHRDDLVNAAVAEIAHLQQQGFGYIKF